MMNSVFFFRGAAGAFNTSTLPLNYTTKCNLSRQFYCLYTLLYDVFCSAVAHREVLASVPPCVFDGAKYGIQQTYISNLSDSKRLNENLQNQ